MRALLYRIAIAILLLPISFARAETPQAGINARGLVESAEISGIDEDELAEDLRVAVRKLIGQPFDQQVADDLRARIQAAKPEFLATTRLLPGDRPDRVRVIFLLERTDADRSPEANVNSRYTVERVEIHGFDESKLSQAIRDELPSLVGEKLDSQKADQIQRRIEDELRPRHYVIRRVTKGSNRQHIVVIYDIRSVRWIPFVDLPPQQIVYHSKQNFSGVVNANIFDTDSTRLFFGLADDQDQLIERFAGFNFGFETTKVGTDRFGLALRYARYHDKWQPSTVLAAPNAIYRERSNFEPTITVAFDPRVRVTAGVSLSDLQIQFPDIHNADANAAMGSLYFQNVWGGTDRQSHSLQANYDFRAGTHKLDSEFIYTRHLVQAQYVFGHGRSNLLVRFSAGTIAGQAPLFERFSLGNTTTLRGWNKFDIAPAGGDRMVHGTLQYGFGKARITIDPSPRRQVEFGPHVFYDVGAVGDRGTPIQARHSAGFGLGPTHSEGFFIELGFPIRTGSIKPMFMVGFRF